MNTLSSLTIFLKIIAAAFIITTLVACNIISAQIATNRDGDVNGARAAKAALMASSSINAAPLRVSKRGDVIDLSGYVESEEEKQEAESIIRKLYPESSIKNVIRLR